MVEIVSFTGSLAHTCKDRIAAVKLRNIIDQFHDDDGLAHARPAKRSHFAAFQKRANQIDHLNARSENLWGGRLIGQRRSLAMNGVVLLRGDWTPIIDRRTSHIENTTE